MIEYDTSLHKNILPPSLLKNMHLLVLWHYGTIVISQINTQKFSFTVSLVCYRCRFVLDMNRKDAIVLQTSTDISPQSRPWKSSWFIWFVVSWSDCLFWSFFFFFSFNIYFYWVKQTKTLLPFWCRYILVPFKHRHKKTVQEHCLEELLSQKTKPLS